MDTVTTAIITALSGHKANPAAKSDQEPAIEAYETLKAALCQKYGTGSEVVEALVLLEKQPASTGRQMVLREEIAAVRAEQDPTLRFLAQSLLDKLRTKPGRNRDAPTAPSAMQRPAQVESFTGREAELTQLTANLQPGQVVNLWGPEGIGKSALAAAAIWKLAPDARPPAHFPNGIFYHNFFDQPRVDIFLEQIARNLGESPMPTPYEAVQRALAKRQALLVFDSAEYADDLAGLLELRGNCGVLVTSLQRQDAIALCQEIGPLTPPQAGICCKPGVDGERLIRRQQKAFVNLSVDCLWLFA